MSYLIFFNDFAVKKWEKGFDTFKLPHVTERQRVKNAKELGHDHTEELILEPSSSDSQFSPFSSWLRANKSANGK